MSTPHSEHVNKIYKSYFTIFTLHHALTCNQQGIVCHLRAIKRKMVLVVEVVIKWCVHIFGFLKHMTFWSVNSTSFTFLYIFPKLNLHIGWICCMAYMGFH